MGLRAASVRHSDVVMAPALTEAGQSQNFSLPPSSPINSVTQNGDYVAPQCKGNGGVAKYAGFADGLLALSDRKLPARPHSIMSDGPTHMGDHDDTMGLQKAGMDAVASLLKDKAISTNDVDQLLSNLDVMGGAGDVDLMQVIKSMEASAAPDHRHVDAAAAAPTSDAPPHDAPESEIFPMNFAGSDLFSEVDMMTMCEDEQLGLSGSSSRESRAREIIEELYKKQLKLERRSEFLLRRLRKLQARSMGRHVSGEIVGLLEHIHRTLRKPKDIVEPMDTSTLVAPGAEVQPEVQEPKEPVVPVSSSGLKNLAKKLEMTAMVQSNVIGKQRGTSRYFGSGSMEHASMLPTRAAVSGTVSVPKLSTEVRHELDRVSGLLHSEVKMVENQVDSDATASSSGGESCDEMQTYNNPHQQFLST